MEFKERKAIYLQLAERLCLEILQSRYGEDERIPSVREFAAQMEVNANTAVRSYEWMQQKGIIHTRRGLGYFVSPGAKAVIETMRREEFINTHLPELFANMQALHISMEDVEAEWRKFNQQA